MLVLAKIFLHFSIIIPPPTITHSLSVLVWYNAQFNSTSITILYGFIFCLPVFRVCFCIFWMWNFYNIDSFSQRCYGYLVCGGGEHQLIILTVCVQYFIYCVCTLDTILLYLSIGHRRSSQSYQYMNNILFLLSNVKHML